jgi:predicted ATP-dependent serine protease
MGVSVKKDFDSLMSYLQLKIKKVPSPYKTLNSLIDGGHPAKAVSMYFGESNIGKTTFLCNDAAFAISNGFNALYITLEMPDFEIFKKIAANLLEVEVNLLKNCNIMDVKNKINSICTGDLKIIEYPSFEMTAHDLKNILQELDYKEKFKPDIIFIDYVNCMISSKESGGKRHEDLGYIMKELENVAKAFDLPIISCSQLNRDGYGSLEVSAKNIGESIDIIKYCANGYAIMRDSTMKTKGLFLVKILKNRYGSNDLQFYLKGNMPIMKIRDASRDETETALSSLNMANVVDESGSLVEVLTDGNG